MIRILSLLTVMTVLASASEKTAFSPYMVIGILIAVIALFFWGVYKAVRTQKLVYAWALLPFILLLFWMFFS